MNFWWSVTNVTNWGGDWALDRLAGGRSSFSGLLFWGRQVFWWRARKNSTTSQQPRCDMGRSLKQKRWLRPLTPLIDFISYHFLLNILISFQLLLSMYRSLSQKQILFKTQALIFVQVLRDSTQAESNQEKPNARVVAIRQRAEAATLHLLDFYIFRLWEPSTVTTSSLPDLSDRYRIDIGSIANSGHWKLQSPGSQREIGGCIYDISDLQVALQNRSCGFLVDNMKKDDDNYE